MILPGGITVCIHLEWTWYTSQRTCEVERLVWTCHVCYMQTKGWERKTADYYHPIMKRSFGSVIGGWCQWFHLWIVTCDVDGWPFVKWQL